METAKGKNMNNLKKLRGKITRRKPKSGIAWVQTGPDSFSLISVSRGASGHDSTPPPLRPASSFRTTLHQALEASHRQQRARRALGAHAPLNWREVERVQNAQSRTWTTALTTMLLFGVWFFLSRRREKRVSLVSGRG